MQNSHTHPPNRNAGRRSMATFGLEQLSIAGNGISPKTTLRVAQIPRNSIRLQLGKLFFRSAFLSEQLCQSAYPATPQRF